MATDSLAGIQRVIQLFFAIILGVAVLHWGRDILLPLSMAVLLTFLLTPLVNALERRRFYRVPAVLLVMAVLLSATIVAGWSIVNQFNDLAKQLPTYRQNLQAKLDNVRVAGGTFQKIQQAIKGMTSDVEEQAEPVQPVRIVTGPALPFAEMKFFAATVLAPLADAAFVLVLVIFMLISREDMRNRLVRLAGNRLALTTRTLDEVGTRISRYLLLNAMVNGGFGIAVGIGLALIGVQYAAMWGFLAAVLRFIPYIGPILASIMPVTMAIIQFPGADWLHPILAAVLFIVLELIANNVIEPLAYGSSTGVSTVALIVAALFWTWVWGPIGLALAVPLTVVFAVLGEFVPALEPLAILLGDKPPLAGWITYYQRLLAADMDEAAKILADSRKTTSSLATYDSVVIPALVRTEKDRETGELLEPEQAFIWQATHELLDDWEPDSTASTAADKKVDLTQVAAHRVRAHVIACPARDLADEMALEMLRQGLTLDATGSFEVLPATMLASEMLSAITEQRPDAVCISSLGYLGGRQTRYLCKRIRQSFPELPIIVGRWGYPGNLAEMTDNLKLRGADRIVTTLVEALDAIERLTPTQTERKPENTALAEQPRPFNGAVRVAS